MFRHISLLDRNYFIPGESWWECHSSQPQKYNFKPPGVATCMQSLFNIFQRKTRHNWICKPFQADITKVILFAANEAQMRWKSKGKVLIEQSFNFWLNAANVGPISRTFWHCFVNVLASLPTYLCEARPSALTVTKTKHSNRLCRVSVYCVSLLLNPALTYLWVRYKPILLIDSAKISYTVTDSTAWQ